jgi:hypothetical protein
MSVRSANLSQQNCSRKGLFDSSGACLPDELHGGGYARYAVKTEQAKNEYTNVSRYKRIGFWTLVDWAGPDVPSSLATACLSRP